MACSICHSYIYDYMMLPMRPDNILFKQVHAKRLQKIIPDLVVIFERFFAKLSDFEFSVAAFIVEKDAVSEDENELSLSAYRSMAKWFKMNNDYGLAKVLIYENCITKNPNELIGFWLSELFVVKEIHMEHSKSQTKPDTNIVDELYA